MTCLEDFASATALAHRARLSWTGRRATQRSGCSRQI
jgi:hypothetical protein